jgi:hypothetical protein
MLWPLFIAFHRRVKRMSSEEQLSTGKALLLMIAVALGLNMIFIWVGWM